MPEELVFDVNLKIIATVARLFTHRQLGSIKILVWL
jgi:hypothetical protein